MANRWHLSKLASLRECGFPGLAWPQETSLHISCDIPQRLGLCSVALLCGRQRAFYGWARRPCGTYGHHHPDFLREAADAIASRPAPKKVALVVSLVEEKEEGGSPASLGGPGRSL